MNKPGTKFSSLAVFTSLVTALTLSGAANAAKPLTSTISLKASTQTLSESAGSITITVTSSPAQPKSAIKVPFTMTGTASNPADHDIPVSGVITIPAGSATGTATFKLVDDTAFENSETVSITLGLATAQFGAKIRTGAITSQLITIADNDTAPTVQFSTAKQSINETTGMVTATLQLGAASGKVTTVPYAVSGTATAPADHDLVSGTVTIPPGSTTANITFKLLDDGVYEGDESVILTLVAPTNATLGTNAVHTVTALDSSTAPAGSWSVSSQSVLEDAGKVTLNLKMNSASTAAATFPFTVSGTAVAPGDHDLVTGSITMPAGATSANLVFNIVDDKDVELDETVVVTLGAPTGALLGTTIAQTITIKNNDVVLLPVAQWSAAFQTVNENVGVITATATINTASATAITLPFIVAGSALRPADHDLANGTITIPAGALMGSTSFSVIDDTLYELDETVVLSMGAPVGATLGTPAVHTITLTNNDLAPSLSFSAATQSVSESGATVTVTATLDKASGLPASAALTVGGTATNPTDHSLSNSSVTIPAGATSQAITFAVLDDTLYEGNETVSLTLASPMGALLGAISAHTVTITDNDLAPIARFTAASQMVEEGLGTGTIQVELDKASSRATSIPYTVSGTATNPGDHNLAAGTLTIAAGLRNANISFTIVKDAVTEPNETVIVSLGSPTGATLGTPIAHTLTITDTVLTPTVQWMLGSQTALESAGTITVTAALNAPGTAAVTVPFTVSGTAATPSDHNLVNGSVTIPAGSTTANVSITVVDDALDENDETIILTMGTPTGGTLGTTKVHTATLTDNDLAPLAQFATASETLTESAGTTTATVTLSAASGKAISVPFVVSGTATNPADHNLASGAITIPAGSLSGAVTFSIIDDAVMEVSETVILTLGAPTNATLGASTIHTKTITDNETASTLQWSLASQNVSEAAGTVTVQAALSSALSVTTTFPFTVSGTATSVADHNAVTGSLTIPAGSLTANATFAVVNDTAFEGDETVIFTMGNPSPATLNLGARSVHTVTIKDDEVAPVVGFTLGAQSVSEAIGTATVTLTLNAASASAVTVPYTVGGTATNPADHTLAAGSVSFAAGITSRTISVPVVNDTVSEANETVILTLGTPTGATLGATRIHTLTITDNDALPSVQWSLASQAASEAAGTVTLTATLNVAGASTITVPVTAAAGSTALSPADYTVGATSITFPVGSTSASYTVTIVNDTLNENNETVTFALGAPVGATLGAIPSHALTLTDNDAAPTVQWTLASQNGDENTGSVIAVASLSAVSGKDISVGYTVGGNANASGRTKYVLAPGTISIPAGTLTKNLPVTLANDNLPGPSDFYFTLTLATPVNSTLGATVTDTITIVDNDQAALMTEEGFRVTVWPLTRARCIGCHGASGFLPNHASDMLTTGHDAAKALTNFADIPNSRMVLKSADGHCGAFCMDNGTPTATKPLMIAAITAWKPYLTMAAPSPTPTGTSTPVLAMTATAGIKDAQQYLEFLAGSIGTTSAKYAYTSTYVYYDLRERLSSTGDSAEVTQTMLLAYTSLATFVCNDFVTIEKALAASSRQAFGPIDFVSSTNVGTTVLSQANMNTVTMNLARIFMKRDATAEEQAAIFALITGSIAGITPTATDTTRLMVTSCTAIASSLESISN